MTKKHWTNPFRDAVAVPIERLAECVAGGYISIDGNPVKYTAEVVLEFWYKYGNRLDAYILPAAFGGYPIGVKYGPDDDQYLSPYGRHHDLVEKLLEEYRNA